MAKKTNVQRLLGEMRRAHDLVQERRPADDRAADDPSTPRLYALLQRADEVDLGAHLAMVRYHLVTGKLDKARALTDAVVLLHAGAREAWEMKVKIAEATGDVAGAEEARLEAVALADDVTPPFAAPGAAAA